PRRPAWRLPHRNLDKVAADGDDLAQLKGVGPRLAETLAGLGFVRFEQIAGVSPTEVERLDAQLGAFLTAISTRSPPTGTIWRS
ncbi:hypothetical protein, partial [Clostridium perfringens]